MAGFGLLLKRGASLWGSLSKGIRTLIVMAVVSCVLGGALAGFMLRPRYVPLYTDLDLRDVAAMGEKLSGDGVPYRLRDEGRTVLVPQDKVYQARVSLAAAGLPRQGTVGFEILDKTPLGATEADRRLAYLRALQGELARTVAQVEGVADARVHLVVPEPQLFTSQTNPVTAAVMVRLKSGQDLEPDQVRGIVHLITHSVEGLKPEDVSVVDQNGRVLSAELAWGEQTPLAEADRLLALRERFQSDLERRLQGLLEPVLGAGNVVTRVAADLNLDSRTVERQVMEPGPGEGVLRSIQESQETFQGAAGVSPPAGANIPGYQAGGQGGPTSYERRETTRNLEVGQTREHLVILPGSVRRLSVAVVVNRELGAAEQAAISELVAAAIGSDPGRQDQITVTGMPFQTRWLEEPTPAAPVAVPFDWRLAAAAGGALVLLLGWWLIRRRRRRRAVAPAELPFPLPVPEVAAAEAAATGEEVQVEADHARVRAEVEKLARKSPETVAQLVRAWMAEE